MTRAELYSLDTYANQTLGRPINPLQCAACGNAPTAPDVVAYGGLCPPCQRKTRPDQEIVQLFRPVVRQMPKAQA